MPFEFGLNATSVVLAALVICFILEIMFARGDYKNVAQAFGIQHTPDMPWYKVITSMFIHYGILHLICAVIPLCLLGPVVERNLSILGFIVIYAASGFMANFSDWAVDRHSYTYSISIGSTGAMFGLLISNILIHVACGPDAGASVLFMVISAAAMIAYDLITNSATLIAHTVGGFFGGTLTIILFVVM